MPPTAEVRLVLAPDTPPPPDPQRRNAAYGRGEASTDAGHPPPPPGHKRRKTAYGRGVAISGLWLRKEAQGLLRAGSLWKTTRMGGPIVSGDTHR